jgi:hypothetical protein
MSHANLIPDPAGPPERTPGTTDTPGQPVAAVGLFARPAHVHLDQPLPADPAAEPADHGAVGQPLGVILPAPPPRHSIR